MSSNLSQRATTGVVFVLVLLSATWHSFATFAALFGMVALIGLNEFYGLFKASKMKPNTFFGLLLGALTFTTILAYVLEKNYLIGLLFTIPITAIIFVSELYRKSENPFSNIALTLGGVVYVVLPFGLLLLSNFDTTTTTWSTRKFDIVFAFFFMLWANDTGAYFAGTKFGKHKLFERISPKKSWEGFIGGALISLLTGYFCHLFFHTESIGFWLLMSFTVVIFATWGDLVESMLKRSLGVKDSGTILPGHGGILDRFDGLLLAAPMVFFLLQIAHFISKN